jgi:hypothetical protein
MTGKVGFRSCVFPACQAVLTGSSTFLGIVLVLLWRPDRARKIPFYSDSSHNDPERVLLACGENLACFFMPLVALLEYLHQSRMLAATAAVSPNPPRKLRWLLRSGLSTAAVIQLNFAFTLVTTIFFFVTANIPSKWPFTLTHQFAASGLIVTYSVQSVLKAVLANTFNNYEDNANASTLKTSAVKRIWERYHMRVRLSLVYVLWVSLLGTWLTFAGGKLVTWFSMSDGAAKRAMMSASMAFILYAATTACVVLMVVMAIDMRADRVILFSSCIENGTVDAYSRISAAQYAEELASKS